MLLSTLSSFLAVAVKATFTGFPVSCSFFRKALNVAECRDAWSELRLR